MYTVYTYRTHIIILKFFVWYLLNKFYIMAQQINYVLKMNIKPHKGRADSNILLNKQVQLIKQHFKPYNLTEPVFNPPVKQKDLASNSLKLSNLNI